MNTVVIVVTAIVFVFALIRIGRSIQQWWLVLSTFDKALFSIMYLTILYWVVRMFYSALFTADTPAIFA